MNNESQTPQTDHFLDALPANLPAEERLDQLSAHARDQERIWRKTAQDALDNAAAVVALRDLCDHAAAEIESGGDLQALAQVLRDAAGDGCEGLEQSEEELLDEAAEIVRAWRVLKQYGTGDESALRERRKVFDADCDASGFSSLELMERGEKKLDQDNAERILGQQH